MSVPAGVTSHHGPGGTKVSGVDHDIHKVAERKRAEADRMRYDLNAALKDLVALQSQVMMLERENSIIDNQLKRGSGTAAPHTAPQSRRPVHAGTAAPAKPVPSLLTSGGLKQAIYQTDSIKKLVDELEAIKTETADIEYRGHSYEHMRARLADEVVECRRSARSLQDKVSEERGRNGDLHRKEMEVQRQVTAAQNRLNDLRRDIDNHTSRLRADIRERQAFVKKKKDLNVYLETQLQSADGVITEQGSRATVKVNPDEEKRKFAQMLTAKGLNKKLSKALLDQESEENRFIDALRAMNLPPPQLDTKEPSEHPPVPRPQSSARAMRNNKSAASQSRFTHSMSTSRLPHASAKPGVNTSPTTSSMKKAMDLDFVVDACFQQDSIRRMLLQRLEAEDARMQELQKQMAALRAPTRTQASPIPHHTVAVSSPGYGSDHDAAVESSIVLRPESAGHRPSNRDLAERDKEVSELEKQLQLLQGENEFLMTAVMPLRMGLAGMAHKMLGSGTYNLADEIETSHVLKKLSIKSAAIVEEIRKAIALADPDGHTVTDWTTLQAEEIAEALEAAKMAAPADPKSVTATKAAASRDALSPYMSPYNIRVPAGRSNTAARAPSALRSSMEDLGANGSIASDDDDAPSDASSEADDEEKDVLNRGELKKMSQKLIRLKRRQDANAAVGGKDVVAGEEFAVASRAQMLRNMARSRRA